MTSIHLDLPLLQRWTGQTETSNDTVRPEAVAALAATLDSATTPREGDKLPPLWHWINFWALAPQSQLGEDGHPRRGGFLPPVPLPRRMWAGGRLQFHRDVPVGAAVTRRSTILSVTAKQGASGPLAFVTVRHEISHAGQLAITEEHDIVYRDMPAGTDGLTAKPAPGKPAPADPAWRRAVTPDPVMLFRYSALTFNGHRIHYDRSYVTSVEGYPGLVVHGPLIATFLLEALRSEIPAARIRSFTFRAVSPLFDTEFFAVCGKPSPDGATVFLWAENARGELAMQAEAVLDAG
jgi:3-methylfumaryl-CoA hydratase